MNTTISELMQTSQVKFGTSGARGLVKDMTEQVCYAYTLGFIQYLRDTEQLVQSKTIVLAGDLRDSTPVILNACAKAIIDCGLEVIYGGQVPTPAVALYGLVHNCPAIMVTGSHIPDDRNGIKFYKLSGEILKDDEQIIKEQSISISDELFDDQGSFNHRDTFLPLVDPQIQLEYKNRYIELFPQGALSGKKIGVYQHSGVAREIIPELLEKLGAEVVTLGFSEQFIPVDTEAVRDEDIQLARQWAQEHQLDAIVSTDGDADRPLISDENGQWLRGDIVGILCSKYLHIGYVVTPVSSNTCVESSGFFTDVIRTRIGSPYVIQAMNQYVEDHCSAVAGYEANGGFLLATPIRRNDCELMPLPTRDAIIVLLTLIHSSVEQNCSISQLLEKMPQRFTYSDRLKNFAVEKSQRLIHKYTQGNDSENISAIETDFSELCQTLGAISHLNTTDGLRVTFKNNDIIHFRPSGNAPEFRCYSESVSVENAQAINTQAMQRVLELSA